MIVAFSTSSPWASVALIEEGQVLAARVEEARHRASEACLRGLEEALREVGRDLGEAKGFAADLGPGSFTGVRVGIVLAKTLAFVAGVPCFGTDAFDLVDAEGPVALPSKRGEWFLRLPGSKPRKSDSVPPEFIGYGFGREDVPPEAARFAPLLARLEPVAAVALRPRYLHEPSISQPKKPFGAHVRAPESEQ